MAESRIFQPFMDMLKELGITPTGNAFEQMQKERDLYTALESVRDFPLEWFPELKRYAMETGVLNPHKLVDKMRAMLAQKPTTTFLATDEFIEQYMAKKRTCGCADYPACQPEWRRRILA